MGLYTCNGNVDCLGEDGACHPVNLTAKEKEVVTKELEGVTFDVTDEVVDLPADAVGATIDEIIRKFNINADRPVTFDESKHAAATGRLDSKIAAPITAGQQLDMDVSNLISSDAYIEADGSVVGTLPYVDSYPNFSSVEDEQKGNYFPLKLGSVYTGKEITIKRTSGEPGQPKTFSDDDEVVLRLTDGKDTVFEITADEVDKLTLNFAKADVKSTATVRRSKKR